jgi:hypothetical protein
MKTLQCEMKDDCKAPVTHVEEKGYIYCTEHAIQRRTGVGWRNRKLRPWELRMLRAGGQVPSYKPIRLIDYLMSTQNGERL